MGPHWNPALRLTESPGAGTPSPRQLAGRNERRAVRSRAALAVCQGSPLDSPASARRSSLFWVGHLPVPGDIPAAAIVRHARCPCFAARLSRQFVQGITFAWRTRLSGPHSVTLRRLIGGWHTVWAGVGGARLADRLGAAPWAGCPRARRRPDRADIKRKAKRHSRQTQIHEQSNGGD